MPSTKPWLGAKPWSWSERAQPGYVTQVYAYMGRRGSGKTYGAGRLAESMLADRAQIIVLDPVGNWWGLRLDASGKRAGWAIPVLGGDHGDLPLNADAGAVVADMIVDTGSSAVLDISEMRKGERKKFVTEWARTIQNQLVVLRTRGCIERGKAIRAHPNLYLEPTR